MSVPRDLSGRHAIVLGLGHFGGGLGAARWLLRQGARVTVTDQAPAEALARPASELAAAGARLVLGGRDRLHLGLAGAVLAGSAAGNR